MKDTKTVLKTYKLSLSKEECNCSIVSLYKLIAESLDIEETTSTKYDCSKILVSKNIFDEIKEYYKEEDDFYFGMIWVCYGPKVDERLKDYEVVFEEGFIKEQ